MNAEKIEITEAEYTEYFGALPPISIPGGFQLGEPYDFDPDTKQPTYHTYTSENGRFYSHGPMTTAAARKQLGRSKSANGKLMEMAGDVKAPG